MPASCFDDVTGIVEGADEGDALNASAAALSESVVVNADDKRRAVILTRNAGSDDPDDAGMPAARTDDDAVAALAPGQPEGEAGDSIPESQPP